MAETNAKSLRQIQGDPAMVALGALGWILTDPERAQRMLALTGLTPDILRDGVSEPATLAAVLTFLEGHEPDLIAAATHLGMQPEMMVKARMELEI
jgi:Protein of unknown function (DUF3572)